MKKIINTICFVLGCLSLGIGVIGIILPILPTTPFFLLSAFLFAKSSARFHQWFVNTGLYQKYIEQAVTKKRLTLQSKIKMMITLGIIFAAGILFSPIWHAKVLIAVIAAGHLYYFLYKIKTIRKEPEIVLEEQ